jgi:hypothetical protein
MLSKNYLRPYFFRLGGFSRGFAVLSLAIGGIAAMLDNLDEIEVDLLVDFRMLSPRQQEIVAELARRMVEMTAAPEDAYHED